MNTKTLNVIFLSLFVSFAALFAKEQVDVSAIPAQDAVKGMIIEVPVVIDVTNAAKELGSYTALLSWDPAKLEFIGHSGGLSDGFNAAVINENRTERGSLRFADANPNGAVNAVNVLNIRFRVLKAEGAASSIALNFTAMAAAKTFEDMLPMVEYQNAANLSVEPVPEAYELKNYPNPFNPETTVGPRFRRQIR